MYLIASLGNPSPEYDGTRHNLGRVAVERWLSQHDTQPINVQGFSGRAFHVAPTKLQATSYKLQAIIVTPDLGTYMNESGPAIAVVISFYRIPAENLILVHDDTDLPLGTIRISKDSSAAGHHGVESIINTLGTKSFVRLRLGIESRENKAMPSTENFVLQKFSKAEIPIMEKMLDRAVLTLNIIITDGSSQIITGHHYA